MNIWVIKDGENLPINSKRKMRTWLISDSLVNAGHSVVWWSSTHDHQKKIINYFTNISIKIKNNFKLKLLYSGGYSKNSYIKRYLHHIRFAIALKKNFHTEKLPDLIICSFPLIESTYFACKFAKKHNIPIIIDVRDPWPDIILKNLSLFPKLIFYLISTILNYLMIKSFNNSSVIISCSYGYLDWAINKFKINKNIITKVFYLGCEKQNRVLDHDNKLEIKYEALVQNLKNKFVIFFVGSFGHTYDLETIVNTAKLLTDIKNDKIHFILAGDGPKYSKIFNDIKRLKNISLTGWINQDEIVFLTGFVHVGIIPMNQMKGCLPNKFYDYLSLELPILSSLEGDAEILLEKLKFGLSYKKNNALDLLNKIMYYYNNPKDLNLHSKNSKFVFENKFNNNVIYTEFINFIDKFKNKTLIV